LTLARGAREDGAGREAVHASRVYSNSSTIENRSPLERAADLGFAGGVSSFVTPAAVAQSPEDHDLAQRPAVA
jgi:hypothetical protein